MAEPFFSLSRKDRIEVLETARDNTGRPTHLLEKDAWVVWTLGVLFDSPLGANLTFKGGTSLSKAHKIIDRFSEDLDLTYDIRKLIGDLTGEEAYLPASRSQANKWTNAVRERLPGWIIADVAPRLAEALARDHLDATLEIGGNEQEKLLLHYPALARGSGYVSPIVVLEFGGRATGEPHQVIPVACDMEGHVPGVSFPVASPMVMSVTRTFWEKATAAHVYCAQGRIRSERFARHWHDLAAIGRSNEFSTAIADRAVAQSVADHKSYFFSEKDVSGEVIDYAAAVAGQLRIVPDGAARTALADDYMRMVEDQILLGASMSFDALMDACHVVETRANEARRQKA